MKIGTIWKWMGRESMTATLIGLNPIRLQKWTGGLIEYDDEDYFLENWVYVPVT